MRKRRFGARADRARVQIRHDDTPDAGALASLRELTDLRVDVERRFTRIERLLLGLGAVIGLPKLGGVDAVDAVQAAIAQLLT
jgi:hypothetical protein